MDVDSTVAVLKQAPQRGDEDIVGEKKVSGNLTIWVVRAEGLKACDSNGRSDPYTVIRKNKKVMARTRTIESEFHPVPNKPPSPKMIPMNFFLPCLQRHLIPSGRTSLRSTSMTPKILRSRSLIKIF